MIAITTILSLAILSQGVGILPTPRFEYVQLQQQKTPLPLNARLAPTQEMRLQKTLSEAQRFELMEISKAIAEHGQLTVDASKRWAQFIALYAKTNLPPDTSALVTWVLRDAYLASAQSVKTRAAHARQLQLQKKSLRRTFKSGRTQSQTDEPSQTGEKEDELANVDLRQAMQRQQQLEQVLAHVSKQLHDVALTVIRKIGG